MSNQRSIERLDNEVINQIAAGEVVERPSHLVKELVENSLDAGSTQIEVEYDLGGRNVRVTDNGSGIKKEDLALALARHATSKISKADDLWNLHSFGFRGEALASIAAVSRVELVSRVAGEQAYKVTAEFGLQSEVEPSGGNFGTTITIKDLFENVPARLKFLKSESAEHAQIKNVLKAP
jgi:DNA mismatch repair protein MutL